jgi:AhpD family alkylhydroperoxidase
MKLDKRTKALIAVGASVAANCQPCLQSTLKLAMENGSDPAEIEEAIEVGKRVRIGAASKMDKFLLGLGQAAPTGSDPSEAECGCS